MSDFLDDPGSKQPHWRQGEVMQFVTFRLNDALPSNKVRGWKNEMAAWRSQHPQPWAPELEREYHRRFTWKLEGWLDEGDGSCLLCERHYRKTIEEVLMQFQGELVEHHAWVIMPNHLHLLFTPLIAVETLMKTWKEISTRRIGRGGIWQKNHRESLITDARQFANSVRYIRRNPAKLGVENYTLWQDTRAGEVPSE